MKRNCRNTRQSLRQEQFAKEDQVSQRTPNSTKEAAVSHQPLALDPGEKADRNCRRVMVNVIEKPKPTPQEVWVGIVEAPKPAPRTHRVMVFDSRRADRGRPKA